MTNVDPAIVALRHRIQRAAAIREATTHTAQVILIGVLLGVTAIGLAAILTQS